MRPVTEKRYKCVVCPDYDLYQICMEKGIRTDSCHSDHEMVRRFSNGKFNFSSDLITENAEIKVVRLKLSLFFQISLEAIKTNSAPSYFLRDHMEHLNQILVSIVVS